MPLYIKFHKYSCSPLETELNGIEHHLPFMCSIRVKNGREELKMAEMATE
jgi:hypothetical protein